MVVCRALAPRGEHGHRRGGIRAGKSLAESVVERVIGSTRRECLDHVIVLHERNLQRVFRSYLSYLSPDPDASRLDKDTPDRRRA
jgi:hypothetical protein